MLARAVVYDAGEQPGGMEKIAEFSRFLIREDRSPATVRSYEWALRDFRDFLQTTGIRSLDQVTRQTLEAWQDRMVAAQMKPRSRSLATTALRMFLRWAADHDYCDPRLAGWLARVRLRPLQPKPIPTEDLNRLRAYYAPYPVDDGATGDSLWLLRALRNRALFFYLLSTGARISEALQVPREGFERVLVRQKGGTEKLLVVPDSVQVFIKDYIALREDRAALLFVGHPGEHVMDLTTIRMAWIKVSKLIGITSFTTHQLRHTFATELLERGIDSRIVAALMGHRSMGSIMGYMKVLEGSRQLAMRAIEEIIQAPTTLTADPRTLVNATRRRGRPKFRILPQPPGSTY